jgi:hypothetical protein
MMEAEEDDEEKNTKHKELGKMWRNLSFHILQ